MSPKAAAQYAKGSVTIRRLFLTASLFLAGAALTGITDRQKTKQEQIDRQSGVYFPPFTPIPGQDGQLWYTQIDENGKPVDVMSQMKECALYTDTMAFFPVAITETWPSIKTKQHHSSFDLISHINELCKSTCEKFGNLLQWYQGYCPKSIKLLMMGNQEIQLDAKYTKASIDEHFKALNIYDNILFAIFNVKDGVFVYTRDKMLSFTREKIAYVADDFGLINPMRVILVGAQTHFGQMLRALNINRRNMLKEMQVKDEILSIDKGKLTGIQLFAQEWALQHPVNPSIMPEYVVSGMGDPPVPEYLNKVSTDRACVESVGFFSLSSQATTISSQIDIPSLTNLSHENCRRNYILKELAKNIFFLNTIGKMPICPTEILLKYVVGEKLKLEVWNLISSIAQAAEKEFSPSIQCKTGILVSEGNVWESLLNILMGNRRRPFNMMDSSGKRRMFQESEQLQFALFQTPEIIFVDKDRCMRYEDDRVSIVSLLEVNFTRCNYLIVKTTLQARALAIMLGQLILRQKGDSDPQFISFNSALKKLSAREKNEAIKSHPAKIPLVAPAHPIKVPRTRRRIRVYHSKTAVKGT